MTDTRRRLGKLPIWLSVILCFVIPIYANILWEGPPPDMAWIEIIGSILWLGAWLSMPQILMVVLMYLTRQTMVRWALFALSAGSAAWMAHAISYPFKTASSMATAHVIGPIYAIVVVAFGGIAILAAEWLTRKLH